MSYTVKIKSEAGKIEVAEVTGTVPEGTFHVNGHRDEHGATLGIFHFRPDGSIDLSATAQGTRSPSTT